MSKSEPRLSVKVQRQDGPDQSRRWESFAVQRVPGMTVADVLHDINADPRTVDGQPTSTIVWASACTWPACGVCTMLINGKAAPACGTEIAVVQPKRGTLRLAAMSSFPVRRDLWVDRSRMARDGVRAEAYCGEDRVIANDPALAHARAGFAACTSCGACIDACPEAHQGSRFVGPHALGAWHATRLHDGVEPPLSLLGPGGVADCGHVENCLETCPEAVPLDRAIAAASKGGFKRWLNLMLARK